MAETETPSQPRLPSPHLFDLLPHLHEILARLDHTTHDDLHGSNDSNDDIGAAYANLPPLDPKDLPKEILPLKALIRQGLREVGKLPDVDRSVEEQQEEIAELEAKMKKQEAALRSLAASAKAMDHKLDLAAGHGIGHKISLELKMDDLLAAFSAYSFAPRVNSGSRDNIEKSLRLPLALVEASSDQWHDKFRSGPKAQAHVDNSQKASTPQVVEARPELAVSGKTEEDDVEWSAWIDGGDAAGVSDKSAIFNGQTPGGTQAQTALSTTNGTSEARWPDEFTHADANHGHDAVSAHSASSSDESGSLFENPWHEITPPAALRTERSDIDGYEVIEHITGSSEEAYAWSAASSAPTSCVSLHSQQSISAGWDDFDPWHDELLPGSSTALQNPGTHSGNALKIGQGVEDQVAGDDPRARPLDSFEEARLLSRDVAQSRLVARSQAAKGETNRGTQKRNEVKTKGRFTCRRNARYPRNTRYTGYTGRALA